MIYRRRRQDDCQASLRDNYRLLHCSSHVRYRYGNSSWMYTHMNILLLNLIGDPPWENETASRENRILDVFLLSANTDQK